MANRRSENLKENTLRELQNFGLFHKIQYFLVLLSTVFVAMSNCNYIFVAEDVNYRCRVTGCENGNLSVSSPTWWPDNVETKCKSPVIDTKKYKSANDTCNKDIFYETFTECQEWIYEHNNSIVAELDLACQPWKAALVGSIHNAGMVFSALLSGWLADKIGRKPVTIICSTFGFVGVVKVFITNYYGYLAIEFLESVVASGLYTVASVILIEVGGESKRVFAGVIFAYAVYVGEVLYAFTAMGLVYWKSIVLVINAPMIVFIAYALLLKESNRWQMVRGQMQEAKNTLKLIAKLNNCNVTAEEIDAASSKDLKAIFNVEEKEEKESIKDIMHSKEIMTRITVSAFCFFTASFLYYGSLVYSALLPGDKYINFVLGALTSFPGDLLSYFAFQRFGRKLTLQFGFVLSATFLIAQNYSPNSITWLNVSLFLMGKLCIVICMTGMYTYSLELFPTSVRGSLLGWGHTAARVGSMLAPLTTLLMSTWESFPAVLFASFATISACLMIFVPETMSLPMFDTIAQIEAYTNKNKNIPVQEVTGL